MCVLNMYVDKTSFHYLLLVKYSFYKVLVVVEPQSISFERNYKHI